jgi:hypothetical protein
LFEIDKGIEQSKSQLNPFLVNEDIATDKRRIPFRNIEYIGDGLTDILCFSLVKAMGGRMFEVFDPANPEKAKQALQKFLYLIESSACMRQDSDLMMNSDRSYEHGCFLAQRR